MTAQPAPEGPQALLRQQHKVLELLSQRPPRPTVVEVARLTGWPEHSVRRLAMRQPGWLIGADGRVLLPKPRARTGRELYAALDTHREQRGWSWTQLSRHVGLSTDAFRHLAADRAQRRTREIVEAWLAARPAFSPQHENAQHEAEQRTPQALYAELEQQKWRRQLSWTQVAMQLYSNVRSLHKMRAGVLTPSLRDQVEKWLANPPTRNARRANRAPQPTSTGS